MTGHCIDRSIPTYRFDAEMTRQAKARDGHCRAPGCAVPATGADQDHVKEWAQDADGNPNGGPTSTANNAALHRRHHNLKTRGHWTTQIHRDGSMTWTTLAGRVYTTEPMDYHAYTATTPDQPGPGDGGERTSGDSEPITYDTLRSHHSGPRTHDDDDLPITARKPQHRPAAPPPPRPVDHAPPPF